MASAAHERERARVSAVFGGGVDSTGAAVSGLLERVELTGGEVLFRSGEVGDSMYVVATGRLRVIGVDDDGNDITLSELGPDQPVGEMAIVTGDPRQATVVAIRDTALYRLKADDFDRLLETSPAVMRGILTELARRVNAPPMIGRSALAPRNLVLIPAGSDAPLDEFAAALASFLADHRTVKLFDRSTISDALGSQAPDAAVGSEDAHAFVELATAAEEAHDFVIYVADATETEWGRRALRQADLILAVGHARHASDLSAVEQSLTGSDRRGHMAPMHLVLVQANPNQTPVGTQSWLSRRDVAMVHHVHLERRTHFARLARFIVGRPVGLVLSGGSARAFAHIGVLRALREAEIPVDIIVGTSAGALIGAQFARGWDDRRLEKENVALFSRSRRLLDFTIPYASIISSARFNGVLDTIFDKLRFEDLWIQFLCTTTNMTDAELRTHRRGELRHAVRASCSLPMLMPPVVEDGKLYADGGIMNNVPVDQLLAVTDVGSLIVVNVTNPFYTADEAYNYENSLPFWRVLNGRFNPFSAKLVAPGIMNVLMRSLEIGTKSLERDQIAKADVYVRPDVGDVPYTDASGLPGIVQAGHVAATRELAAWEPDIPFREPLS